MTADAPAAVVNFTTNTALPGITKAGKDTRALFYGPYSAAVEVRVVAAVDSDVEVYSGSIVDHTSMELVSLQASELAAPTPEMPASSAADRGQRAAISISVLSWKMT